MGGARYCMKTCTQYNQCRDAGPYAPNGCEYNITASKDAVCFPQQ